MSGVSKDDLESIKQDRVTDANPTKETVDLRVRSLAEIFHLCRTSLLAQITFTIHMYKS